MMSPNERWDDFTLDREFDSIRNFMQVTATLPNQLTKLMSAVEHNNQRIESHHNWIESLDARHRSEMAEVKAMCERIGRDVREDTQNRARYRNAVIVAIIGAAGVVAAAIAGAILASAPH